MYTLLVYISYGIWILWTLLELYYRLFHDLYLLYQPLSLPVSNDDDVKSVVKSALEGFDMGVCVIAIPFVVFQLRYLSDVHKANINIVCYCFSPSVVDWKFWILQLWVGCGIIWVLISKKEHALPPAELEWNLGNMLFFHTLDFGHNIEIFKFLLNGTST